MDNQLAKLPENYQRFKFENFRDVRKVEGLTTGQRLVGIPVNSDSLKHLGIFKNDLLITVLAVNDEPQKYFGKLCVWQTPLGRVAQFAEENFDGIMLHNKAESAITYALSDVQLVGFVTRIERDL